MSNGIYKNDGSGRDSYVNAASMSERQRRAINDPAAKPSFWPNTTQQRQRAAKEHLEGTLSAQPKFELLDPTKKRSFRLEALTGAGAYESPRRNLSPQKRVADSLNLFTPRGSRSNVASSSSVLDSSAGASPSPLRSLVNSSSTSPGNNTSSPRFLPSSPTTNNNRLSYFESTTMAQMRTGRFELPTLAPPVDGRLPGMKRGQQTGVLDEI